MKKCSIVLFILSLISCLMTIIFLPLNGVYSISYDLDGGTFETAYFKEYTAQDVIDIPVPSKKGYEFVGWTGSNGDTPQKSVRLFGTTGNKKYTANWEVITYSITYNLSGGSVSGNPTSYNINSSFMLYEPVKNGYIFLGWTGSNGSIPEKLVTIYSGSTGNKTYTANWEYIQNYSITYNLDGGSVSGNPTSYNKYSSTITLKNPTKTGYDFLGWTGSNGSTPEKTVTIYSGSTGNKTYTANWEYIQNYSISYNLDGGSVSGNPTSFNKYSSTIILRSPTRSGYEFLGWTGSNGTIPEKSVRIYSGNTGNKTYTANWKAITTLIISEGTTYISSCQYKGWDKLVSVTIPNSVTSIGSSAFRGCISLTNITIPDSVTSIGDSAFESCISLTSITIPNSVTGIGYHAFSYCRSLQEITLPFVGGSYLGYIFGASSYSYNSSYVPTSLKKVTITKTTSIRDHAFYECSGLTDVTIPNSVTRIGEDAFDDCSSLISVYYTGTIENWYNITFSNYYSNPMYYASHFYIKNSNGEYEELTEIEIPNTITEIKNCTFCGFNNVTKVTIPNSLTSIGKYAFYKCSSLTSITIPNSVTSIGECAFSGCSRLTSITIPNSVTSIGSKAFNCCYKLVEVYNLSSLNIKKGSEDNGYVGYYAKDIYTSLDEQSKLKTSNGVVYYIIGTEKIAVAPKDNNATGIVLDDDCTKINQYAFYFCSKLTSITIGNNVTSIGSSAFSGCSNLTSITIPNGVTSIGGYAFSNCSSLTKITIPNSVTSIGGYPFSNCSSLTDVYYTGTIENWCNITFNSYSSNPMLYASQFYIKNSNGEYEELTEIEIPNAVTKINKYAFLNFNNVTKVTIPNSVTSIGECAFRGCINLTSVTIGNSVKSIGYETFYLCYKLVEVYNLSSLNIKKSSNLSDYGYISYYAKDIYTSLDQHSKLKTSNGVVYYINETEK